MRFDSTEHGYGKFSFSGLMIGYIVSMTHDLILDEVNDYQKKYCAYNPDIVHQYSRNGLHYYYQRLIRINLMPKAFGLTHLWINMGNPL